MYELLGCFMRRKRLLYISFNHASSIYLPDSTTYGSRGWLWLLEKQEEAEVNTEKKVDICSTKDAQIMWAWNTSVAWKAAGDLEEGGL